ncbi:hypothetical protein LSUE1_G006707 [Lachnellula suecica]|uniref:Uncharacterized protein n=1 Tax=Lachnellula suecica TaxID=602035 RepID=A0A8T9BW56_9HELO|nr:hypothetical protein LSUE1_G006707 [Lachnellula suecica]
MSSSTALLPKQGSTKKDDHPIFLRVCHSPWVGIGQKSLVGLRTLTSTYLLVSGGMIIDYEIKKNKHGWLTAFEFSNVAYAMLTLYQVMAATWTFMHLHYPHHRTAPRSMATRMQSFLSPPRQHESTKNRTWFSIFYTAATTFPHLATLIYWALLIPMHKTIIPGNEITGHGWFREFFVVNKFAIASFIAFVEVFIFSSIRRQTPVAAHIAGITFLAIVYQFYAYIGHEVTEKYAYFYLDHKKIGWQNTYGYIAAFVVAANFCMLFFQIF